MNLFALLIGLAPLSGQPANFTYQESKAVFVDFQKAEYTLELNVPEEKATGFTKIRFEQSESGHIVFDLRTQFEEIKIDGELTSATRTQSPGNATNFLVLNKATAAGIHELEVRSPIKKDISFKNGSASAAFWFSDLDDGEYLEQYFPANMEYDQYSMELLVKLIGNSSPIKIFTNGDVLNGNPGESIITFPDHYNCAAPFFHMGPAANFSALTEVFVTSQKNKIPVTIYGKANSDPSRYMSLAKRTLNELEADYGIFPHAKLVIYGTESFPGGMEHQGATITNLWALAHEITHSYFGRGLMPSNGDAGWLDEAMASWRDDGYRRISRLDQSSNHMAKRSQYIRFTPMSAYNEGAELMAYFDSRIALRSDEKGLKTFLNKMMAEQVFKPGTTEEFQASLEAFAGEDMSEIFNPLVYGIGKRSLEGSVPQKTLAKDSVRHSKYHGKLTDKVRKEIL